ncbi:hypothetical protein ACLKA7_009020 [Drosophila subpalustris]
MRLGCRFNTAAANTGNSNNPVVSSNSSSSQPNGTRMLFENPAVAAKLPFPYNVPPPLQAAAAAAAAVPNLR